MRYQLYRYAGRRSVPDSIVECAARPRAIELGRGLLGADFAGARALDVECDFCEDRPVPNAETWTNPNAAPFAACPRCGKGANAHAH